MRLSFSLSQNRSSASPTPSIPTAFESSDSSTNGSTPKQFITEFDPSQPPSPPRIIPPNPNDFRPFRNLHHQLLQFHLDASSNNAEENPNSIPYGLNVRKVNTCNADIGLIKYREDMSRLPDGPGPEEFEDMPVEGYGAALMAGYGWREGRGIGRNAAEDVKVVQYTNWNGKQGLGFLEEAPQDVTTGNKDSEAGETLIPIMEVGRGGTQIL